MNESQNQPNPPGHGQGNQGVQKESDVTQTHNPAPKQPVIPVPGGVVVNEPAPGSVQPVKK